MSSRYFNQGGFMHCQHGRILYGTSCVTCDREELGARLREDDHLRQAAAYFAEGLRWEHASDPRPRSSHWQQTYTPNPSEIITDPLDQRGVDAKRVRAAA